MSRSLRIAIISTDYPPLRTSAAVQLHDLAKEFLAMGHCPVAIVPSLTSDQPWRVDALDGIDVLRVAAPPTRMVSHLRRALAEMWLPFVMLRNLRRSPYRDAQWDLVVWYSPPIFFAPLVWVMRRRSQSRAYLILRDIFPEWALDLGILKKGPAYFILKAFAALQYAVADVIGVQTPANLSYMHQWMRPGRRRVEVLHNWLEVVPAAGCRISVAATALAGRRIFVYIGNMGVAQDMSIFMDLIERVRDRNDLGFIFVGRGTEFDRLAELKRSRQLDNFLLFDEIDSREIPGLLAQCDVGLVALHPGHKTHNIPGKFVSYMQYGLPVLARVNRGTDLVRLIEEHGVGRVYVGDSVSELRVSAEEMADNPNLRQEMSERSKTLGRTIFSVETAARQIVASLD
jgi:glycosyltransferase involved in cell wall biosynthesis